MSIVPMINLTLQRKVKIKLSAVSWKHVRLEAGRKISTSLELEKGCLKCNGLTYEMLSSPGNS